MPEPRSPLVLAPLAVAMLLAPLPAHADWRISPTLKVSEIWTDNINLTEEEFAHSDLITQVSPGLTITNRTRRLVVDVRAQLNAFEYLNDSDKRSRRGLELDELGEGVSKVQRSYRGSLRGELARDLFFIDASAARGQQSISAFGPRITGDSYSNANRADIETWSISPYLVRRFGNVASGQLRFTRDAVGGASYVGFNQTSGNTLQASLASGPAFRTVAWGLNYTDQDLQGARYGNSSTKNLSGNVRYILNRQWSLLGNAGYDRYEYEGLGGGQKGANWSLGFAWTPSPRTSVQATAGRHFFGNTGSLLAVHRSRYTSWNVSYSDAITTSRQQFMLPSTIDTASLLDSMFATAYPDPVERERVVAAYMQQSGLPPSLSDSVNYLTNRFIRQKQLRASMLYRKGLSTASLSAHSSDRTALSNQQSDSPVLGSQQGSFNSDIRQHGVAANYTYRLNSRSNLSAGYDIDKSESLTGNYSNYQRMLRVGLSRRFGEASGSVELRRRSGDRRFSEAARTYTENMLSASLSMTF